ncbi:MAG: hypothetical protein ACJ71B_03035 [Nitrososphaera sp.]
MKRENHPLSFVGITGGGFFYAAKKGGKERLNSLVKYPTVF